MSAKDLENMSLEKFGMWKVVALKEYLTKKGLNTVGSKSHLVARCYCAWENGVPDVKTAKEIMSTLAREYQASLLIGDVKLPDPLELKQNWESEKSSMQKWPPTMISDISEYLAKKEHDVFSTELRKRLLKDYKDQKSFSYFSSRWLFEVYYNEIYVDSDYCFLKANCTPSQSLNAPPYTAWVAIKKKDGEIISAYCTCFAGLGQSCNHVAAILLKIDFCWRMGYVSKSCTSKECAWNVPSGAASVVQPMRIKDMNWQKPSATGPRQRKEVNPLAKRRFCPTVRTSQKGMTKDDFMSQLKLTAPNAVCHIERTDDRLPQFKKEQKSDLPKSPYQLATSFQCVDKFINEVNVLSLDDRRLIEKETHGQAQCQDWFEQRKGRITSSLFHNIMTKMNSYDRDNNTCMDKLLANLCGYSESCIENIPAVKYGRNMEDEAFDKYNILHQSQCGKKFACSLSRSGLFIDQNNKFLAASPDGIVNCFNHDIGLLEIKCPLQSADKKPLDANISYLKYGTLNKKHQYYTQIQGQLAVTGKEWCDFFVYSRHGSYCERIMADTLFWKECEEKLLRFYKLFLAPELIFKNLLKDLTERSKATEQISYLFDSSLDIAFETEVTTEDPSYSESSVKPYRRKVRGCRKKRGKKHPIYVCTACLLPCKDEFEFKDESENSIECSNCSLWCHWKCTGMDISVIQNLEESDIWLCKNCDQQKNA